MHDGKAEMTTQRLEDRWDAIVLGAGAGGLFTAARLAAVGRRVLVLEAGERAGGRAGVSELDGFLVNDGAVLVELAGILEQSFAELGHPLRLYLPKRALTLRAGKRDVSLSTGLAAVAVRGGLWLARTGLRLFPGLKPAEQLTTSEWLARLTRSARVHGLVRNMCGALFAAGPELVSARFFLDYFTKPGALKSFGFAPGGTGAIWAPLVEVIEEAGGRVLLGATATSVQRDHAGGGFRITSDHAGGGRVDRAPQFVNDAGPAALLSLAGSLLPLEYVQRLRTADSPSALITVHFASREPLAQFPALALFAGSRRLAYAGNFSAPDLARAPEGWHLYSGASVPQPAVGDFDEEAETALLLEDLREQFPGFDRARILRIDVTRGTWPGARSLPGRTVEPESPVPGLWNVGDGASLWATAGISACAQNAQVVADRILAAPHGATSKKASA
ncbi:MAG: amine oxidase [Gammaproteobacteria bacterium]|nr:amine oxidase [Gammaproteobacteria bacterium]